jgi:hypothetical protein
MNKGDFMRACKVLDDGIKEIDSAYPMELGKSARALGLDTTMLCMVYWKNGTSEVVNIAQHWAELYSSVEELIK